MSTYSSPIRFKLWSKLAIRYFLLPFGLSEKKTTTDDLMFTVETVSCLGACGLAPVLTVNDVVHPEMNPDKAAALLKELREKEAE